MDPSGGGLGESLGEYLRDQRRAAQLSLRQLAERAEVSNPYLSQVERGLRQPSAQVLNQIARGLRISTHALYVRAGLLADELRPDEPRPAEPRPDEPRSDEPRSDEPRSDEPRTEPAAAPAPSAGPASGDPACPAVPTAVRNDPHLLDRHKLLLLDLYDTFRRDAAADRHPPADARPTADVHPNADVHPTVTVIARSTP